MSSREALLFGISLAHAYSHCMLAGGKAKTGDKLAKSVWVVWQASEASKSHAETASSSADRLKTESSAFSPERPAKAIKKCLSSPSQIMTLYTGHVKVPGVISSALIQKNQED